MSLAGRLKTLEVPRLLFTAGERAHAWREGHPGTLGSPRHWSNPSTSESSKDFVDYFCPGQSSFSHYLPLKLQLGVPSHFCRHAIRPPLLRLLKKKKTSPGKELSHTLVILTPWPPHSPRYTSTTCTSCFPHHFLFYQRWVHTTFLHFLISRFYLEGSQGQGVHLTAHITFAHQLLLPTRLWERYSPPLQHCTTLLL